MNYSSCNIDDCIECYFVLCSGMASVFPLLLSLKCDARVETWRCPGPLGRAHTGITSTKVATQIEIMLSLRQETENKLVFT